MNHARSIKEMLSIPTGSRNVAATSYSSFSDSQLFFGSQFWPENSQGTSQDMSLSSRNSQQSSQEGSDPKFISSYHTKPVLFGESKDKTKGFGVLDTFEEYKKKAKEKTERDILAEECLHIRETLSNIQQLVAGTDKNDPACLENVLESFCNFSSTLQNNLNSFQSEISQQLETLLNKVNSHTEMMKELEERRQKSGDTMPELVSDVQSLKKSLEVLRHEQEREQSMLEEALHLLNALVSENAAKHSAGKVMDTAIQTSPQQDNTLPSIQFAYSSNNQEHNQVHAPPQDPSCIIGKRKSTSRVLRKLKNRSKRTFSDENRPPLIECQKRQSVSTPLCERRDLNKMTCLDSLKPDCLTPLKRQTRVSEAAGCFISPLNCWPLDSNSPTGLLGIDSVFDIVSDTSKSDSPVKAEGLLQLFDMDGYSPVYF